MRTSSYSLVEFVNFRVLVLRTVLPPFVGPDVLADSLFNFQLKGTKPGRIFSTKEKAIPTLAQLTAGCPVLN